ncbi:unnamed protein product, partial [Mesorhabditis belari]|uniref:Leprecan-like alpha-helical domain-containing protein n=1 Tax=Mesorhabditis belari TaxID=2138241 RepID=A0AAF3FNU4_9BILA
MAYSRKEWSDCVGFLRRSVEDFNYYNDEIMWCREMCEKKFPSNTNAIGMAFTHLTAQRALCLFRCKRDRLTEERPSTKRHLLWYEMEEREPYRYLSICYWNLKDLKNAVKAAYTYLVRNPEHQETIENLQFYMKQEGFEEEMLDDFQRKEYENLYMSGVSAYHQNDWWSCIDRLERSFEKVLREEELCRMDCKDKIDWSSVEGTLEIDIIQTSMKASVLRCESQCFERLSWVNGHKVRNIIASHFEYIHICQYNLMRGTDACTSVANYLLFDDSPLMRRNRFAYNRQYKKADLFTPDPKILALYKRSVLEKRLLEYIDKEFRVSKASQLAPESSKDREKWSEEIDSTDYFPYDKVERLLTDGECKVLRAPIRTKITDLLLDELSTRQKLTECTLCEDLLIGKPQSITALPA